MTLSHRRVNLSIFVFAAAMLSIAYFYFEKTLGLLPCPMCVSQRIFTVCAGLTALIACIHNPANIGRRVYGGLTAMAALGGASISARQVWLQSLPEDQVPGCGPAFGYLYEYFPIADVLNAMFIGEGSCAEVVWSFLGLSIPAWTLICFVVIFTISAWQSLRRSN